MLTIGIFTYINISIQKKYLIEGMKQNGIQLGQTIEGSIRYEMLTAQNDQIQRTLEDIGNQEGIENIRIFDKKGKIIAADSMGDIGKVIDREDEACFSCHKEREPLRELPATGRTRIFKSGEGFRILGIINPIYNEPKCYNSACHFHPSDQDVLGVMDILVSLETHDKQIGASRKKVILYFLFTFLFISLCLGLFIFLFVNAPIRKLIEGTRKISKGDLNYRIGSYRSDEIGELGKSFDKMTTDLKISREEIEQWNLKLKNEVKKATEKLRKTNEKLNQANKQLQDLDKMKSDFMRKMEHGSRSHLALIQSCLSLSLGDYYSELNEQQKDLIETAKRRSSMLLELLDDILLLSFRQSSRDVYHMKPIHLSAVIQEAIDDLHTRAQKKNIKIDVQIPKDFPQVFADPQALGEVFSNLLNNALKYSSKQSMIKVSAEQKGDFVEIDVSDAGIGIASEDLLKIFDEFYRAPNAKSCKVEGTGLGLNIVKEIIKAHQGSLEVQSELGKGSTFTVSLPKKSHKKK